MGPAITFVVGLAVGLIVGRWSALVAPALFGVWVAAETNVEVPHWLLGVGYAVIGGAGVALGVVLRRVVRRNATPS